MQQPLEQQTRPSLHAPNPLRHTHARTKSVSRPVAEVLESRPPTSPAPPKPPQPPPPTPGCAASDPDEVEIELELGVDAAWPVDTTCFRHRNPKTRRTNRQSRPSDKATDEEDAAPREDVAAPPDRRRPRIDRPNTTCHTRGCRRDQIDDVDNKKLEEAVRGKSRDPVVQLYTRDSSKSWRQAGSDGSSQLVLKEPSTNVVLADHVITKKWEKIVDFDDHLDYISKDWLNQGLLD